MFKKIYNFILLNILHQTQFLLCSLLVLLSQNFFVCIRKKGNSTPVTDFELTQETKVLVKFNSIFIIFSFVLIQEWREVRQRVNLQGNGVTRRRKFLITKPGYYLLKETSGVEHFQLFQAPQIQHATRDLALLCLGSQSYLTMTWLLWR